MQIKLKLVKSQFLFSENINLIKNKEVVVDSDTLTNTDIKILSGKIRSEELESNVSADKILEFLSEEAIQELKEIEVKAAELQVEATVEAQGKGKKVVIFKFKAKKNYRKKKGHRQPFTKVKIEAIEG